MMIRRASGTMTPRAPALALLATLLLAGCTSPEPAYYALAAVPGIAQPGGPHLIELRRPSIAGYLDRSEIVRGDQGYRLDLRPGERWGEPFGTMIGRVLAEDLGERLPGSTVFTDQGSLSPEPQARIELNVQRFDLRPDGHVSLLAQVALSGLRRKRGLTRTFRLDTAPSSASTTDLVAAMSRLLGQLADGIAAMLR